MATFAFVGFAFAFSFSFAFGEERISTTRSGFGRHIPVLSQEILLERGKCALIESGVGAPAVAVRVELRPALYRGKEIVDARKFGDVMSGTGEKLIILSHRAAEIAGIGKE